MNYEQQPESLSGSQTTAARNRILLLDGDEGSRDARSKALRSRGAIVDPVGNGADARSLWRPGSHDVVLIDFRKAGPDVLEFYEHAHGTCGDQKFGFYIPNPPYLTTSHARYQSASKEPGAVRRFRKPEYQERLRTRFQTGVPEAARRITAAKLLSRPPSFHEQSATRGISFADAVKNAERVLDAGKPGSAEVD